MTVIESFLSKSKELNNSNVDQENNEVVIIPDDVSYGLLRHDIMLGIMPVNTIVKINTGYYEKRYKPLLFGDPQHESFDDSFDENYIQHNFLLGYTDDNDNDDFDDETDGDFGSFNDDDDTHHYDDDDDGDHYSDNSENHNYHEDDDYKDDCHIDENDDGENDTCDNDGIEDGDNNDQEDSSSHPQETLNNDEQEVNHVGISYTELTIIVLAMLRNDEEFVNFLLKDQVSLKFSTSDCGPIIYTAISMKKYDYVHRIIEDDEFSVHYRGSAPQIFCYDSYSLLDVAVVLNDYKMVEYFLTKGAQINVHATSEFQSPLQRAAWRRNIKMMKFLIERGAHINYNVLKTVCETKDLKVLKLILSHPAADLAPVGIAELTYRDSVFYSFMRGSDAQENLTYLLDFGFDVNIVENGVMFYNSDSYSNECNKDCVNIFKEHVIKLVAAGIPVCEENKKAATEKEYQDFLEVCEEEVETLKEFSVNETGWTFYDVLHRSRIELIVYLENFDNTVNLEVALKKKFPLYGGMLALRIVRSTINSRLT